MNDQALQENPFPGLRAFEMEEEHLFFGREKQVDELLRKLRTARFIAVLGSSGSGKSSLVKCGLLPALYSGFMVSAGSRWQLAQFRPGDDPLHNLASSLAKVKGLYDKELTPAVRTTIIESTLRRSNLGLIEAIRQSNLGQRQNLLILVDQFEEIFRFRKTEKNKTEEDRDSITFINLLLNATKQEEIPIYIVFTMRSEFLDECTRFGGLPEAINEGQYLIPRMDREQIKSVIRGPAAVCGATVSNTLVTRLVNDIGDDQDQLPVLQHAMMRTWQYWQSSSQPDRPIELGDYEAIGKMVRALNHHADEAYNEMDEIAQQQCKIIFQALTERGSDGIEIRRPTTMAKLARLLGVGQEQVEAIIEHFSRPGRSFLIVSQSKGDDKLVDISHESLMRKWARLREWVQEEAESAKEYLKIAERAEEAQSRNGGMLKELDLQLALNWRRKFNPTEEWAERYDDIYEYAQFHRFKSYLDKSEQDENDRILKKERDRRRNKIIGRVLIATALTVAIIVSILAMYAFNKRDEAIEAREKAEQATEEANEATKEAVDERLKARDAQRKTEAALSDKESAYDSLDGVRRSLDQTVGLLNASQVDLKNNINQLENTQESLRNEQQETEKQRRAAMENARRAMNNARIAKALQNIAEAKSRSQQVLQMIDQRLDFEVVKDSAISAVRLYKQGYDSLISVDPTDSEIYKVEKNANNDIYSALEATLHYSSLRNNYIFRDNYGDIRSLAIHSGSNMIATGDEEGRVMFHLLKTGGADEAPELIPAGIDTLELSRKISSLAFGKSNSLLIAGTQEGSVHLCSKSEGKYLKKNRIRLNSAVRQVEFANSDDNIVIVVTEKAVVLYEIESEKLKLLNENEFGSVVTASTLSDDKNTLLTATIDGLHCYRVNQGSLSKLQIDPTFAARGMTNKVSAISIAPDNRWVAFGFERGDLEICQTRTPLNEISSSQQISLNKVYANFFNSLVSSLAFYRSPDQLKLAVSCYDRSARIVDVNYARMTNSSKVNEGIITLRGHTDWVYDLTFYPNGKFALTVGKDNRLRVWHTSINDIANLLQNL